MRVCKLGWVLAGAVLLASSAWAVPDQGQTPVLSPAVMAAVAQLSADDYAQREKAVAQLQTALGQEVRAMMDVQDPEALARMGEVLGFEQGLCGWAKDVLKLPRDKQKAAMDLGLRPDVLPHVAGLYAKETSRRVEAVKALRKLPDAGITDLLVKALDDTEQRVYVAAMEGVWDRAPTEAVVESLWSRAVTAPLATMRPQPMDRLPDTVTFRGNPIPPMDNGDTTLYLRTQDNQLATEVLAHLQAPGVPVKLKALFEEVEAAYAKKNPNGGAGEPDVWIYMPSQESMKNAVRLAEAYKPKEVVPVLYRIATGPALQKSSGQLNGHPFYWSNRTWALAMTASITGQSTADWNLKVQANLSGLWTLPSEAEEKAAMAKLREWWAKDHEKWGGAEDKRPVEMDVPVEAGVKILR